MALAGWMHEAGYPPPRDFYRAKSWITWGVQCNGPLLGAVAVLGRTGGGHMGIVTAVSPDGGHVRLLGGNQGDRVSQVWFPVSRVLGYRRPAGPMLAAAPTLARGTVTG